MSTNEPSLAALYHAALRGLDGIERGTATVPHAARSDSGDPTRRVEALLLALPVDHLEALARLSKLDGVFLGPTVGRCRPDYLRVEAIRWRSKHARDALRPGPLPRAARLAAARFALALADIYDLAAETEPSTC